jgi:4-diphosphocytidyl-2-C-methyl-D-erythritol kinase
MAVRGCLKLPLVARAPAKLNLCLYVGPRRADGLHEICSLFQSVSLADTVTVEAGTDRDEVVCPGVPEPNLALTALERFRSEVGLDEGPIRITIDKEIPIAAGLGGGSADAAAVLRICAGLRGIDPLELTGVAMSVGADVPSQLVPGTHLVTGAGERVEPVPPLAQLACVLLHGVGKLKTSLVYGQADAFGATRQSLSRVEQRLRKSLAGSDGDSLSLVEVAHNDLEAMAARLEPTVDRGLGLLRDQGARAALVSGSGPAVFGLYADNDEAERAASEVRSLWDGTVTVAAPVAADYAATTSLSGSGQ